MFFEYYFNIIEIAINKSKNFKLFKIIQKYLTIINEIAHPDQYYLISHHKKM